MYAVIKTGGKQYRVAEGDNIEVEKIDQEIGSTINFDALMIGGDTLKIGTPIVEGASVEAEVVNQYKGKKVHIIKFKRRKHHMKQQGHRQLHSRIVIKKINA
jgi:large subunit ribosomal protein L21